MEEIPWYLDNMLIGKWWLIFVTLMAGVVMPIYFWCKRPPED